jgi:glycosyltransferase involved in cell wall biosynthesis
MIIPTHNRIEKLTRLLASIEKSSLSVAEREIIVAMDDCSDGTFEILRSFNDGFKKVTVPRLGHDEIFGCNDSRAL